MKNHLKRIIPLALVLMLIITSLAPSAFAAKSDFPLEIQQNIVTLREVTALDDVQLDELSLQYAYLKLVSIDMVTLQPEYEFFVTDEIRLFSKGGGVFHDFISGESHAYVSASYELMISSLLGFPAYSLRLSDGREVSIWFEPTCVRYDYGDWSGANQLYYYYIPPDPTPDPDPNENENNSMWYMLDHTQNAQSATQFFTGVLRLLSDTFNAIMTIPIFSMFIAFFPLAMGYGLWLSLKNAAAPGGKKK